MSDTALLRRHELLTYLLRLSRRQKRALEEKRVDEFLALLDERDRVLDALAAQPSSPPAESSGMLGMAPSEHGDNDARVAVGLLVASVLREDEENERLLREEMSRIREALLRVTHVQAAARGYAAALPERYIGAALDLVR